MGRTTKAFAEVIERALDAGEIPGAAVIAGAREGVIYRKAFGLRDVSGSAPMTMDTVFMLASMTKTVTAVAALQLVERGLLDLDEPLGPFVPEFADAMVLVGFGSDGSPRLRPAARPITLRHLLSHTSGFGHEIWSRDLVRYQDSTGTPKQGTQTNASLRVPLLFDPGVRWEYSIGIEWAGKVIEAVTGQTLGAYLLERVTGPMGMSDTAFGIIPVHAGRVATVYQRDPDGSVRPIDMKILPGEYEAGGGGLYGTADDFLALLQMLLNGGKHRGEQILRPETVASTWHNQIGDLCVTPMTTVAPELSNDFELFPGMTKKWGLTAMITTAPGPDGRSAGALTWGGLANCYFWLDSVKRVAGIFLTQILPFGDEHALNLCRAFEREVYGNLM